MVGDRRSLHLGDVGLPGHLAAVRAGLELRRRWCSSASCRVCWAPPCSPPRLALITRAFTDPVQRTQAFGLWSASFAVSIALGPLVGGPLIDNLSWRWIFYINFPIALSGCSWPAASGRGRRAAGRGRPLRLAGRGAAGRRPDRDRAGDRARARVGMGLRPAPTSVTWCAALAAAWFVAWEREAPDR